MFKRLSSISTDRVLSVTAILIGMATTGIYLVQTRLIMNQQHASVWPCLQLTTTNNGEENGEDYFQIEVKNKGVGPAIVRRVDVYYKGQRHESISDLFGVYIGNKYDGIAFRNSSLEGLTVAIQEEIRPLVIQKSKVGNGFKKFYYSDSVSVAIYYQSVYKKNFVCSKKGNFELPDDFEMTREHSPQTYQDSLRALKK
jgi:hypothetical protein